MAEARKAKEPIKENQNTLKKSLLEAENPTSQRALRNLFSWRNSKMIGCSGSICSHRDHNNSTLMQQKTKTTTTSPVASKGRVSVSSRSSKAPLREINGVVSDSFSSHLSTTFTLNASSSFSSSSSSSSSSAGGSFRRMHLSRLSGCYECRMVDPVNGVSKGPYLRAAIYPCTHCGEIFLKSESLDLHQAIRHSVSELGQEDTSRNIVEIIFQSSWLKKQTQACKIERILRIHNTKKTVTRFDDYRDSIKNKASKLSKKHPRCIADGNELLRFYCSTLTCSLGRNGATHLCDSIPQCKVCGIIRDGIKTDATGKIQTMATSGKAHDAVQISRESEKRAMLVCRVIAGRVRKSQDASDEYDSVSGMAGVYANLDELHVFNAKAILPCFVVIYRDV